MECVNEIFPVILYSLGTILLIALIVLVIRTISTLNKVNRTMDDLNEKSHKLDNLFTVIDNTTDIIANISDKTLNFVVSGFGSLLQKFRGKKKGEGENEE